jgi:hypothetical protein
MDLKPAAVLLITFNRPQTTRQVFEMIKLARPERLFIFSDGARKHIADEAEKVKECRALFTPENIDWPCTVSRWFEPENLGCAKGVSSAITRAFEEVDRLIILEDDVVPSPSFFTFCNTMLHKYENSDKVMHISGTRWNEEYGAVETDHYFSTIGHIWGWATWKRAWAKYDFDLTRLPCFKKEKVLLNRFQNAAISRYWHKRFEEVYMIPNKKTWDYQWQFAMFLNDGLSVVPNVNLISNIGILGVHSDGEVSPEHFRPVYDWQESTGSVPALEADLEFEKYHIRRRYLKKPHLSARVKNRLRIISKLFNSPLGKA